jgi:hypothetical protein
MRFSCCWFLAALCAAAIPALGNAAVTQDSFLVRTTADLVDLCSVPPSDPLHTAALNFCEGFGAGAYRIFARAEATRQKHMFCVPDSLLDRGDTVTIFVIWAKSQPDLLKKPPESSIAAFLLDRYPCPR